MWDPLWDYFWYLRSVKLKSLEKIAILQNFVSSGPKFHCMKIKKPDRTTLFLENNTIRVTKFHDVVSKLETKTVKPVFL